MNDQKFKELFKSMDHGQPSEIEMARWKKLVYREVLNRSPAEWTRLAVACLIGVVIGATAFKPQKNQDKDENIEVDATIERVYVNLQ